MGGRRLHFWFACPLLKIYISLTLKPFLIILSAFLALAPFSATASEGIPFPPVADFHTSEVRFESPDGEELRFRRIHSRDLGGKNFAWHGKSKKEKDGSLSFTRIEEEVFGTWIKSDHRAFRFKNTGEAIFLSPLPASSPSCGGCQSQTGTISKDPRLMRRAKNWRNGDGNLIDLLVAYTPEAMEMEMFNPTTMQSESFATESELRAYVENAIAESNLCFLNSRVNAAIRLVHLVEVQYQETQNPSLDLNRSVDAGDGYLDELHSLRDQYGADLVTLLVSEGTESLAGVARQMNFPSLDFAEKAFNVVTIDSIGAPNYTLIHEIGHNMGCLHNREDAMNRGIPDTDPSNSSVFKEFNYGKRWIFEDQGYRTLMSYDTEETITYPNRIPFFSNPSVDYLGISTGNANSEDNAQVLNRTTPYVANFRSSVTQGIVPSVYSLEIPEGNLSTILVRLASKPDGDLQIAASLDASEDQDFSIIGSAALSFTSENWNLAQPLPIFAGSDSDLESGFSTLYLSANGIPTVSVPLQERDSGSSTTGNKIISGVVINSLGIGIADAELRLDSGEIFHSDENGSFLISVSSDWTGTLTPFKTGLQFSPSFVSVEMDSEESISIHQSFQSDRSSVLYVDQGASGNGDGSSWENAYTDLRLALESVHPFSEVWVASGTYTPGSFRSDFFLLPPEVSIYGGFDGSETVRDERNSAINETILSGDLGILGDKSDNSFHIVVPSQGSHIEGFVIEDGNSTENYSDSRGEGGGLYADGVSFSIRDCLFRGNYASSGGAIFSTDSNLSIENSGFIGNQSLYNGGAIKIVDSNLSITGAYFTDHLAGSNGGVLHGANSTVMIEDSNFSGNQSAYQGAGCKLEDSNATISNSFFNSHGAGSNGGVIHVSNAELKVRESIFSLNYSDYWGGVILAERAVIEISDSSLFENNASTGGTIHCSDSNLTILDSNFSENQSVYAGGSIASVNSNIHANRGIFSKNLVTSNNGGGSINGQYGSIVLSQCTFDQNQAPLDGGAIYAQNMELNTTNCTFTNNRSTSNNGGGAINAKYVVFHDLNGSYSDNSAASSGGAIDALSSSGSMLFSQFSGNHSDYSGGAIYAEDSNFTASGNSYVENSSDSFGGAVLAQNGDWIETFANYSNNFSAYDGGACKLENSIGSIKDSNFSGNSNTEYNGGGALSLENSSPSLTNCIFRSNLTTNGSGGAIYMESRSLPNLDGCSFYENKASGSYGYGGALYFSGNSGMQIKNCHFFKNESNNGGAFAAMGTNDLSFNSCKFVGNEANASAASEGGVAILFSGSDDTKFINCLLSDNRSNFRNGVFKPEGTTFFVHCTIVENHTEEYGGVTILFTGESVEFENCILWQNTAAISGDDLYLGGGTASVSHSIIDPNNSVGASFGSDNLSADPLFSSGDGTDGISGTEDDDFSLQSASPAIDQANPLASHYPTTDILGKNRYGSAPDLGAYEYRVNTGPVISQGETVDLSTTEDQSISHSFSASDADGDSLVWTVSSQPTNGVASFDAESSSVVYEPNDNWHGTDSFVLSVSDGATTANASISVEVSPVDDPPVLSNAVADLSAVEDSSALTIELTNVFSDPDEADSLVYSVSVSNESLVTAAISESVLTLSLHEDEFGTATIVITATSTDHSVSDSFDLTIAAANDPPVLEDAPVSGEIAIAEGTSYVFEFNAIDIDGDPVIYSISGADADFFEINASTGILLFREEPDFENPLDEDQNNSYELSVLVSDPTSSSSEFDFSVFVTDQDEYAWSAADRPADHWRFTEWFGYYFETSSDWIYHTDHGWLYRHGESMSSAWLYDFSLQWLWTNYLHYPFFFSPDSGDWLYFETDESGNRRFYDYSSGVWNLLPRN